MNNISTLNEMRIGESALVYSINLSGAMKRRLLDLGMVSGTVVECVGKSPLSDPSAYMIRGAVIAIRSDDGKNILVRKCKGDGYGTD